jgi:hypothetical protein
MSGRSNQRAQGARSRRGGLSDDPPPPGLTYTSARSPTFSSLEPLRPLIRPDIAHHVIDAEPGLTAFEQPANLNLLHTDESITSLDTVDTWARAFDLLILPSVVTAGTRASYYAQWRSIVSFAYIMNKLEELLPMSERLLKAWLLQCVLLGYRVPTIISYVSAIKH